MRIRKKWLSVAALVAVALGGLPAQAGDGQDEHSDNARLLTQAPTKVGEDVLAQGSDLAFQKDLIVAGSYQGTAFYKRLSSAPYIKQVGFHACPSSQGDVSVWGKFVFVSVDSPGSNNGEGPTCNNTPAFGADGKKVADTSKGKEGIRIIDISNLKQPKQVKFIETQCGSHTNVLIPHKDELFIYVNSYPILQSFGCNQANHQKFSIIKASKTNPANAKLLDNKGPVPQPSIGCHDTTVFPKRDIAVAACLQNTNILDIANPAQPKVLSTIVNETIQFHHSSSFTWDGKYAIISDEYAGAAGGGGCAGDQDSRVGAMYFYNIEDPENPKEEGSYSLPRVPEADTVEESERFRCTTHLYNILPTKNSMPGYKGDNQERKYIAVGSYYAGGISAVDFTDPSNPKELAYYIHKPDGVNPDSWAGYWYNNRIYSNDHASEQGVRVFKFKGGFGKRKILNFGGRYNPQIQTPADLFNAYRNR